MNNSPSAPKSIYTITLNELQSESLFSWLNEHHWKSYEVNYSKFAFKGNGVNVVMYNSGKLVIQGKKTEDFIKFVLEPEIIHEISFGYEEIQHSEWFEEHAGMDESGKGDLFGPLVTACVIADHDIIKTLIACGVKDSKQISSDRTILALEERIRATKCIVETVCLSMAKYNELYVKFHSNMNQLLGWMHSCSLKNALARKHVKWGMLDQFSKKPIVQTMLSDPTFDLRMQTKAEADPVVAAASIIARAEYVRQIRELSKLADMPIMKGASRMVTEQALELKKRLGGDAMKDFVKLHFKTAP